MPQNKILSTICFYAGFASIIGSILIWAFAKGDTPATLAHAERFGVFIGLWAPTFLSCRPSSLRLRKTQSLRSASRHNAVRLQKALPCNNAFGLQLNWCCVSLKITERVLESPPSNALK